MTSGGVLIESPEAMHRLGSRIATLLRPGDLVVLDGPLGAGKTTFARGVGQGLGVRGDVSSPTFVIARRHRPGSGAAALLHIDAYRVTPQELEDMELDLEAADAVALVEWGAGKVDDWAADRLVIEIALDHGDIAAPRTVTFAGIGPRWQDEQLDAMVAAG